MSHCLFSRSHDREDEDEGEVRGIRGLTAVPDGGSTADCGCASATYCVSADQRKCNDGRGTGIGWELEREKRWEGRTHSITMDNCTLHHSLRQHMALAWAGSWSALLFRAFAVRL